MESENILTPPPNCCKIITTEQRRLSDMKPKAMFGDFFKTKRIEAGFTLREFCKVHKLDPGNLSRMERGLLKPPSSKEKLEEYASYLGIEKGSNDWYEFFDLAAACRGEIPDEILDDEELLKHLPVIFRTIREKKVSKKKLEELIEIIRRA